MASRLYRFTVEDTSGADLLVYEGRVVGVGRVRVQRDGAQVNLVQVGEGDEELEERQLAPLVLASAVDPGADIELRLRRVALDRQKPGKPVVKKIK